MKNHYSNVSISSKIFFFGHRKISTKFIKIFMFHAKLSRLVSYNDIKFKLECNQDRRSRKSNKRIGKKEYTQHEKKA